MAGVDPTPPAYWIAGIDWKTIAASVFGSGGILAMAWPAVKAWREGRTAKIESEAKRAETAQERLDRQMAENYARVQADRDYAYERIARMEHDRAALEADRDNGWDKARAMEDEAHWQRHAGVGAIQRYNSLLLILNSIADGSEGQERARALATQVIPPETPRQVPPLREITGETAMTFRTAQFGRTLVLVGEGGCMTCLPDGARVPACPHDTDEYRATAERLGYGGDVARMSATHDACHSAVARFLGLPHSPALWAVAHGEPDCRLHGLEEDAVTALETLANAYGIRLLDLWTRGDIMRGALAYLLVLAFAAILVGAWALLPAPEPPAPPPVVRYCLIPWLGGGAPFAPCSRYEPDQDRT